MQTVQTTADPHSDLRALYRSLIDNEDRFREFKQILSLYPTAPQDAGEESEAASVREQLNARIRDWVGGPFEGLNAMQVLLWRSIVVEERFNVALSPWKEANFY